MAKTFLQGESDREFAIIARISRLIESGIEPEAKIGRAHV